MRLRLACDRANARHGIPNLRRAVQNRQPCMIAARFPVFQPGHGSAFSCCRFSFDVMSGGLEADSVRAVAQVQPLEKAWEFVSLPFEKSPEREALVDNRYRVSSFGIGDELVFVYLFNEARLRFRNPPIRYALILYALGFASGPARLERQK
jgi:hypothetical protein